MVQHETRAVIRDLAFLYLFIAQRTDAHLSDGERTSVIDLLQNRFRDLDRPFLQDVVHEVMLEDDVTVDDFFAAAGSLRDRTDPLLRTAVLHDLEGVARADGVMMHKEKDLLRRLAAVWGVEAPLAPEPQELTSAAWGLMHHLAFLYVVLAHGPDRELHEDELRMAVRKLQEWQPHLPENEVLAILGAATERYGRGPDGKTLEASVRALRALMPEEQRVAALHDLVQIANADGIFLDTEEDLINSMMVAWDLGAHHAYERSSGSKA